MDGSEPTSNDNPVTYKEVFQAAKEGNSDKLLAMIAADENVLNIADSNQSTPLTVAFAYGQLELARLLIERGADVNETDEIGFYEKHLPNREGHTALDYCTGIAGEHKHPDIAALLLEHGAKHKSELDSR